MAYSLENPRFCHSCRKALKACICSCIPSLTTPIAIRFLVHAHELGKSQSTGWLTHRSLQESHFTMEDEFDGTISPSTAVLFPSDGSVSWSSTSFSHLIVPDGTWDECRGMLKRHPGLEAIPKIHLLGNYQGKFLGRRAPWPGALSTLEAVSYLLEEMGYSEGVQLRGILEVLNQRELHFRTGSTQL